MLANTVHKRLQGSWLAGWLCLQSSHLPGLHPLHSSTRSGVAEQEGVFQYSNTERTHFTADPVCRIRSNSVVTVIIANAKHKQELFATLRT